MGVGVCEESGKRREKRDGCRLEGRHLGGVTAAETTTGSAGILPAWGWGWGEKRGKRREKRDGCGLEGAHLGGVTAAETTTGSAGILPAWGWGWGEERGKRREKIDGCRLEGGHLGGVTAAETTTGSAGILPAWGWGCVRREERGKRGVNPYRRAGKPSRRRLARSVTESCRPRAETYRKSRRVNLLVTDIPPPLCYNAAVSRLRPASRLGEAYD